MFYIEIHHYKIKCAYARQIRINNYERIQKGVRKTGKKKLIKLKNSKYLISNI